MDVRKKKKFLFFAFFFFGMNLFFRVILVLSNEIFPIVSLIAFFQLSSTKKEEGAIWLKNEKKSALLQSFVSAPKITFFSHKGKYMFTIEQIYLRNYGMCKIFSS